MKGMLQVMSWRTNVIYVFIEVVIQEFRIKEFPVREREVEKTPVGKRAPNYYVGAYFETRCADNL